MALIGLKFLSIFALLVMLYGYHLYNPMPATMDEPAAYGIFMGSLQIMDDATWAIDFLGIKDKISSLQVINWHSENSLIKLKKDDPEVKVTESTYNGVPVLVFEPRHRRYSDPLPALVYIHGGGFCLGSALSAQPFLLKLVRETGIFAVSVDYRLAPQHPFPAALEDCEAASRYIFSHATDLGVDPSRVGVAGDSAGGNMAAVLTQKFRDMGNEPQFMYQMPIYPWVQAIDINLPSYVANTPYSPAIIHKTGLATFALSYGGYPLSYIDKMVHGKQISTKSRRRFQHYLKLDKIPSGYIHDSYKPPSYPQVSGVNAELEAFLLNPYVFPLMADSMKDLPPALVVTMGFDTLRDEGLLYLQRLKEDGVDAEHYHDEKGYHIAMNMAEEPLRFEAGVRLHARLIMYVREQLKI